MSAVVVRDATTDALTPKRARTVADRIVADVAAKGWPVGEVLGSEADLLARYGVSRAVFREAVRLVEHQHVARMRRGPGGGLVVTQPTVDAIIDAAVMYLHRVDARLDEVFAARLVLEEIVCVLAPSRLDENGMTRLRELVKQEAGGIQRDHRALHSLLAAITGNPALELFVDILNRVCELYLRDPRAVDQAALTAAARAHARVVETVLAGDGGLARHRMRRHLEAEAEFLRRRRSTRQVLDPAVIAGLVPDGKRAEALARRIFHDVVAARLPAGHLLGSESDLMIAHGVSRAVLREAVRLLEHHQVATMRRGRSGGLFVAPPSVAAVSDVVALYLERQGIRVAQLMELRNGVELAILDLVADRMDDGVAERLHQAAAAESTLSDEEIRDAGHDLHAVLAGESGNPALELVALVLLRLTRLHQFERTTKKVRKDIAVEVHRTHSGIVEAVIDGDRDLARHRMRRHLDVVSSFLK